MLKILMVGVKFTEHDKNETLLALGTGWQKGDAVLLSLLLYPLLNLELYKPFYSVSNYRICILK